MTGRATAAESLQSAGFAAGPPPVRLLLATLDDTLAFGATVGGLLRAGDLVILAGDLGAGKTALTKGIAVGMGIESTITSPTFVIARVHRPKVEQADPDAAVGPRGPAQRTALVHVDAYRLSGVIELDDLDLDTDLEQAAVVVEWGEGVAEQLADAHLLVRLTRHPDDARSAEISAVGPAWTGRLPALVSPGPAAG